MTQHLHDASGNLADSATSAIVASLLSAFGASRLGWFTTVANFVLYIVLFVAITVVASLLAARIIKSLLVTSWVVGRVINIVASLLLSLLLLLIVGQARAVDATDSGVGPSADATATVTPDQGESITKADVPANADVCPGGNSRVFSSVAADRGPAGLGSAGASRGIPYTSCPFAQNVAAEYQRTYTNGTAGSVSALSPVSPDLGAITMFCSRRAANLIQCDGGNNAHVYIY